jgi:hypothetical protein
MERSSRFDESCREIRGEYRFRRADGRENGTRELVGTEETGGNFDGKPEGLKRTPTVRVNGTMVASSKL